MNPTLQTINNHAPWAFIAVVGVTGAGKSTFIKAASGDDNIPIGDSLAGCKWLTNDISNQIAYISARYFRNSRLLVLLWWF